VVGSVICCFEACGINTLVEFLDEFCDADSLALSEGLELGVERLRHDYVGVSKLRHLGFFSPSYSFLWGLFIWEAAASLSSGSPLLARFRWPLAPRDALARRPGF